MSGEEQKPPTGDQIPSVVGDMKHGYFQLNRKGALGCGNFGSVFSGVSTTDPTLDVAVKFEVSHNGYATSVFGCDMLEGMSFCRIPACAACPSSSASLPTIWVSSPPCRCVSVHLLTLPACFRAYCESTSKFSGLAGPCLPFFSLPPYFGALPAHFRWSAAPFLAYLLRHSMLDGYNN